MTMILFHLSFSSRTALSGEPIERAKRTGVTKWLVTLPQPWRWQARTHTARRVEGSSRCNPAGLVGLPWQRAVGSGRALSCFCQ